MEKRKKMVSALTVAGSDSGGGAGVQADLKVFRGLGVHGLSAITCLTAQNPKEVTGIHATKASFVVQQMEAVWTEFRPGATKTGMLLNTAIIKGVAEFFETRPRAKLVVDPVMVATSGARLLKPNALKALLSELIPLATLVTPNVAEAEILVGMSINEPEDLREAALRIAETFGCAVLVKGGHLVGMKEAMDILRVGGEEWMLTASRVKRVKTHGTGCTYAAAITAYLAQGVALQDAVEQAKTYVTQAIAGSVRVGRHSVLGL